MTPGDAQREGGGWGRYTPQLHTAELGSLLILHAADAALSPNREKIVGALENWEIKTS